MDSAVERSLNRAFELAYFIHRDRSLAIRIVTDALDKLDLAIVAQDKRLNYSPSGRRLLGQSRLQRFRNKVFVNELHLFQRLLWAESEPYEKDQEHRAADAGLSEEDMCIRFVKHLIRITVRRNSFHVTLGLSRLLHNYSTAETMEIYNLVMQNPDRVRDDSYFRARKKQLMHELQERFGSCLKVKRVDRGEDRFQSVEATSRHMDLVRKCLGMFMPWNIDCTIPERFNRFCDSIPQLEFNGGDPDGEHPVEMNRIHAILHPDCYQRITMALRLDSPELRLAIPRFFLAGSSKPGNPVSDKVDPPGLTHDEIKGITDELDERARRRKRQTAGLLFIMVDGIERARLDLAEGNQVTFNVNEGDELIEVRAVEGDHGIPLAVHVLSCQPGPAGTQPKMSSITLEGGQKISLEVRGRGSRDDDSIGRVAEVTYRETDPIRAIRLWWRRLRENSTLLSRGKGRWGKFLGTTSQVGKPTMMHPPWRLGDLGVTRSLSSRGSITSLGAVGRICVLSLGDDRWSRSFREHIILGLTSHNRFWLTEDPKDADAAIVRSIGMRGAPPNGNRFTVQLVNSFGIVLWEGDGTAAEIVKKLHEQAG